MVVDSGLSAGVAGYAMEKPIERTITSRAVKVLADLPEEVAYQAVEFGTPESKLNLPKVIYALACEAEAEIDEDEDANLNVVENASASEVIEVEDTDIAIEYASSSVISEDAEPDTESASEEISTSSTVEKSITNESIDLITDEQKEEVKKLLSGEEKPSIKEIEEKTGLDLDGYSVIKLPLSWENDSAFGGEYNPNEPGIYRFTSEVRREEEFVLFDSALPTISVEVMAEDAKEFSAVWSDDDVEITVTAPAGVFANDSTLKVEKITKEKDNLKIDEAVEKTLDEDKVIDSTLSYDIKVVDAEGKELDPVTEGSRKVNVAFKSKKILDAAEAEDKYVSVYHFEHVDKEDVEKAAKADNDNGTENILEAIADMASGADSEDKLEAPELIKAEEPEQATVTEERQDAPESDDSVNVSVEGELNVQTESFSIFTVAFYSDKNSIKGYYVTLSDSDSLSSFEDNDEIKIRFNKDTNLENQDNQKIAVAYMDASVEEFKKEVAENPNQLKDFLQDDYATTGNEITVPVSLKSFVIISDSDKVDLEVVELHRGEATYDVYSDSSIDGTDGDTTLVNVNWGLKQKFYIKQDASDLQGAKIRYEITGFGSNGGQATVYIPDKDNYTSVQTVIATSDKKSFEIDASVTNFTVEASDIIKVKPINSVSYKYTSSNVGSDGIASIDSDAPTTFTFKAIKDNQFEIDQKVLKNGASFATSDSDKITYKISGFLAGKYPTIQYGDKVITNKKTDSNGVLTFTVPASADSIIIIAKEDIIDSGKVVKVDSATQASGGQNNIKLTTDISGENGYLSGRTDALELVFTVPVITYKVYKNGEYAEGEDFYKDLKSITDVSTLHNIDGYVFKKATIDKYTEGTINGISNFQYQYKDKNGINNKKNIAENSTVTLYYSETTDYPVSVKTENVANGTQIKFILAGSDKDSSVSVKKTKDDESIAVSVNGDNREFTLTTGDDDEYEFTITAEDKSGLTLLVDCSNGATFWQGNGVGKDAIALNAKDTNTNIANKLFIEDRVSEVKVVKHWQDGGRNESEKNTLVGGDVEDYMYLEYFIVGKSSEWKRLTADAELQAQNAAKSLTDADPLDENGSTKNASVYSYKFSKKLFGNYVVEENGEIKTYPIKYRIAEEPKIKEKYISKYEDENGNVIDNPEEDINATVLRNYEKQVYKATIIWHDKDALIEGGKNVDRPTAEKLKKALTLYKVLKGDRKDAEKLATLSELNSDSEKLLSLTEGKTEDDQDCWTIEIEGYAYDKDDYPVYYYLTEKLDGLRDTVGREDNAIINRRYKPRYINVENAANINDGLYSEGTLLNILAGDTQFKVKKEWRDDASDTTRQKRPTAEIIFYRTTSRENDFWNKLSPIQDAVYVEIEKNTDESLKNYELILPGDGKYVDAYNEDGVELIYVGKEKMTEKGQHYVQKIQKRGKTELEDLENIFVKNGDTLVNIIKDTVNVTATKSWIGKAKQDLEAEVDLTLYSSVKNPESADFSKESDSTVVKTVKLNGFSAEETSKSITWNVDEFDSDGNRLFYFIEETGGRTKDKNGNPVEAHIETIDGKTYFVTGDGYRYLQTVEKRIVDGRANTHITNTLVGNAELKLVKKFPNGFSSKDSTYEFKFDVFQDKKKIGTITRKYGKGSKLYKLNDANEIAEAFTIESMDDLKGNGDSDAKIKFADIATISSFEQLTDATDTGLLPRYDAEGKEYTYSIFEHEDDDKRGYYPTMVNIITEEEYQKENINVTQPYRVTEKYLLDTVEISNNVGDRSVFSVYKEWLDGDDAESREAVTFVLEEKIGNGDWEPVKENDSVKEYVINPKAKKYSKYVLLGVPEGIKEEFNYWRDKGKYKACDYTKDGVTKKIDFRVKETKLGDNPVFYYGDKDYAGKTLKEYIEGKDGSESEEYLGHDWKTFDGIKDNFGRDTSNKPIKDDLKYGFVQGTNYDYDVVVNDQAKDNAYRDYQYFEVPNEIGNRNFDFALSNVRVGYIYIDITKAWHDGAATESTCKYRPDSLKVRVQYTDPESKKLITEDVTLNRENGWNYKIGPLRKYDDDGVLINYDPQLISLDSGNIEDLIYNSDRKDAEEKYAKLYQRSGSTKATFKPGKHHTGDVYSIVIHNTIKDTITPQVNKFWEDYDVDKKNNVIKNDRPDIYTHLYRSYVDKNGQQHFEQLDKDKYIDYDWDTKKDEITHNWWQVTYKPMPRFSEDFSEYTYYIGEGYASDDTNSYTNIGAFVGTPSETNGIAKFTYDIDELQKYEFKADECEGIDSDITIVAVAINADTLSGGTLVNSPRDKRTVSGVKVFDNIPESFMIKYLPTITLQLWRKDSHGNETRVNEYKEEEVNGKKTLVIPDETKYLDTKLPSSDSAMERKFTFTDSKGDKAWVPKYDDYGMPYTYTVKEVIDAASQSVLEKTFSLKVNEKETLTNGIEAKNSYTDGDQEYSISFYKKWNGFDIDQTKKYDGKLINPSKDKPHIYVRLYRYLVNENGEVIEETKELVKDKAPSGDNVIYYDSDKADKVLKDNPYSAMLTYGTGGNDYDASCTWDKLPYYAPNFRPYKYVVAELYENFDDNHRSSRPYTEVKEASVVKTKENNKEKITLVASGSNLYKADKAKGYDWDRYNVSVNGTYDPNTGIGSGTAAIINTYVREYISLKIKKLWEYEENKITAEPGFEGINVLPTKGVKFKLYRIKQHKNNEDLNNDQKNDSLLAEETLLPATPSEADYVEAFTLDESNDWTYEVKDLIKYEPRGWYYRYFVKEIVPEEDWVNVPFEVEIKDEEFWHGGEKCSNGDVAGVVRCETMTVGDKVYDDSNFTTGRKNVLKTITLDANKVFSYSSNEKQISNQKLQDLYKLGVIPDKINYRIYYKIDGVSENWTLLKKDGSPKEMTPSEYGKGTDGRLFSTAKATGLLPYAYVEGEYKPISYRAVEYSVEYGSEVSTRSELSIANELKGEGSTEFGAFTNVSSETDGDSENGFTTTVNNFIDVTKLEVTKEWKDEVREFGRYIKGIKFKLQSRSDKSKDWEDVMKDGSVWTQTILKTDSPQKKTFDNLPLKDKNGKEIEYRAVETHIISAKIDDAVGNQEIEIKNIIDSATGDQTGETSAYEYVSKNAKTGSAINYSEIYTTTFTNRLKLGSIAVEKNWDDNNDKYGLRHDTIKVKLSSSIKMKSKLTPTIFSQYPMNDLEIKVLSAPDWRATWSELPVYDAENNEIKYTLTEYIVVDGKEKEIKSYDATNMIHLDEEIESSGRTTGDKVTVADDKATLVTFTNTLATTSYLVEKKWDADFGTDPSQADNGLVKKVNVKLQRYQGDEWSDVITYPDETPVRVVLEEDKGYRYEWTDLPAMDDEGNEFTYRAVEESIVIATSSDIDAKTTVITVDGVDKETGIIGGYRYETEVSKTEKKTTLKNILKKGEFSITKMWDDDNNRDGMRPESVTFHLQRKLQKDSDEKWATLSNLDRTIDNQTEAGDGSWSTAIWSDLPVENAMGDKFVYRVVEDNVEGYVLRLHNDEYSVLQRIINAIVDLTQPVRAFFYKLITGKELQDSYTDKGVVIEEGESVNVKYVNIHDIQTVDVKAEKTWIDNDDKYGDRPLKIEVTLYAEYQNPDTKATVSEIVKEFELAEGKTQKIENPVELNSGNGWKTSWEGLPAYKSGAKGVKITYFVKEKEVIGYNGSIATSSDIKERTATSSEIATSSDVEKRTETGNASEIATYSELEYGITNKLDPTEIVVRKNWDNEFAGIGDGVTGAEVVLQRKTGTTDWANVEATVDGQKTLMSHVINKTDSSWTVTDLPKYDKDGNKYSYRAVESRIVLSDGSMVNVKDDGYVKGTVGAYVYTSTTEETETGFRTDITNRMETGSLKVSKVWDDQNSGIRPTVLRVHLKAVTVNGGKENEISIDGLVTSVTLSSSNNWTDTTTWADVPVYTADGKRIHYVLSEDIVSGYRASYSSRTYGQTAVTGDGSVAARVYLESGKTSEVQFTNYHRYGGGGDGDDDSSDGTKSSRVLGADRGTPDEGSVLGADREMPEEPRVLGAARRPHTGDMSHMTIYGIAAIISLAVLGTWYNVYKKKKKHSAE